MFTSTIAYRQNDRLPGLYDLLAYAYQHRHSARWIPALLTILAREGARHG
jgi:hypothetical protein